MQKFIFWKRVLLWQALDVDLICCETPGNKVFYKYTITQTLSWLRVKWFAQCCKEVGEVNFFHFILLARTPLHMEEIWIATVVVAVAKQTRFVCPSRGLEDFLGILSFYPFNPQNKNLRILYNNAWNAGALVISKLAFLTISGNFNSTFGYNSIFLNKKIFSELRFSTR